MRTWWWWRWCLYMHMIIQFCKLSERLFARRWSLEWTLLYDFLGLGLPEGYDPIFAQVLALPVGIVLLRNVLCLSTYRLWTHFLQQLVVILILAIDLIDKLASPSSDGRVELERTWPAYHLIHRRKPSRLPTVIGLTWHALSPTGFPSKHFPVI